MHYAFSDGLVSRGGSPLQPHALAGPNPGGLLMYRYKPAGLPPGAPLLVILHGCGQTAAALDQGTGWSTLAQRFGFALLAPEQVSGNNFGTCFNWFLPGDTARGQGEAASIRQMILETARDFASDSARIFITGLSAGGGMSSAMLAAYPEVFAAGAIIAGLPHDAASNLHEAIGVMHQVPQRSGKQWGDAVRRASKHKGPWPRVSVWHGDADRIVGISNQGAILAQWQDVHRLTAPPKTARTDTAQHLSWRDDQGRTLLESYTVPGLGHGIPIKPGTDNPGTGGDCCGQPGPFILDAGISSSVRIAEFFGLTESRAAGVPKKPSVIAPVIARLAAILPEPPRSPPAESVEGEILDASPIKRVIVKALTAAGLIRKN